MRAIPTEDPSPFRITSDGTRLFYPWYNFGPGYEVPSDTLHGTIQRYRAVSTIIGLAAVGFAAFTWRAELDLVWRILSVVAVLAVFAHYNLKVREWTHGLKKSTVRIDFESERRMRVAKMNPIPLWCFFIIGVIGVAFGIYMLANGSIGGGLFCIALFGSITGVFGWILRLRRDATRKAA